MQNCILKTFHLRQLCEVIFSQHFLFKAILWNLILKIFTLRQFCGIVFSKYSLWSNSAELYSQNISFEATLRSYIPILSFEAILPNCILKIFSLRQFYGIVFSNIAFKVTLRSCVLKTFPLRQFYWIVFSKPSSLRQFCGIVFSHFLFLVVELHSHKYLRTLYPHVNKLMVTKWDVVLALVFIYCINSTNEGHLLTPYFATINFIFLHFSA